MFNKRINSNMIPYIFTLTKVIMTSLNIAIEAQPEGQWV